MPAKTTQTHYSRGPALAEMKEHLKFFSRRKPIQNEPNQIMNDMSTIYKRHYLLPALTVGLVLGLAGHLPAQTFKVLHSFTAAVDPVTSANNDGAGTTSGLILSSTTLYGAARWG